MFLLLLCLSFAVNSVKNTVPLLPPVYLDSCIRLGLLPSLHYCLSPYVAPLFFERLLPPHRDRSDTLVKSSCHRCWRITINQWTGRLFFPARVVGGQGTQVGASWTFHDTTPNVM